MKLYRFTDWVDKPYLEELDVIKETKCGYWIWDTCKWPNKKRWISKDGHYALTTQELALKSYVVRKKIHIRHLENKIEATKALLKMARGMDLSTKMLEYKTNSDLSFDEVFNKGGF